MESTGRPGQIHITEATYKFLEEKYISDEGEDYEGIYFLSIHFIFLFFAFFQFFRLFHKIIERKKIVLYL